MALQKMSTKAHTMMHRLTQREGAMHRQVSRHTEWLALGLSPENCSFITRVNRHTHTDRCTKGFPDAVTAVRPVKQQHV